MRKHLALATISLLAMSTAALAQSATGTGVGTGISGSNSESGAIAVNKGNGGNATATGTGVSNADSRSASGAIAAGNVTNINSPANTTSTATVSSTVSGTTTSNINTRSSGSIKTNPSIATGLAAAGLETCLGSASAGLSLAGLGLTGGSTYVDPGCEARLDSRTLASFGLKAAAVARICQQPKVWNSMPDVCQQYWPRGVPVPYGVVVVEPAGYGLPVRALMSADGGIPAGTSIRVINGKTGVEGDCIEYSETKQKCYRWAGESIRRSMVRSAAVNPTAQPQRAVAKPKPKPAPTAVTTPEAPKVEPKPEEKKS